MDFDFLSEEQKAKVKACTSPEEMLELARSEGYELTDEQLESISGGWGSSDSPYGDEREDISESRVSTAFMTGAVRGDGLD